jgi:hypothetical protein
MSIASIEVEDMSNYLCKRFATLASSYFDHPAEARSNAAQVPLENLFRVLEMFRNETFSDETRKGVLALENPSSLTIRESQDGPWHKQIQVAIHESIASTFGQGASEKAAANELQNALRRLVTEETLPPGDATIARAKNFFTQLSTAL